MINQKFYPLWIALICIIVFILQGIISSFTDYLILNSQSFIQPWRFISSIFLHGSLSHLVLNLFALLLFGLILEKVIGSNKFLLVYFTSGLIANLIAINFYSSSLGASGAIYGIMGCLAVLRPRMAVFVYNIPMPMFLAAIIWILVGIFGLFSPSNTGHIAHLSGIAIGFLFGLYYLKNYGEQKQFKVKINLPEEHLQKWENFYMK